MCGISGIVVKHKIEELDLRRMTDILHRRGPDDSGCFIHENVGLGHRRLSIIDLESGHQPMTNEDQSVVIVFNGEIYNFLELKEELIRVGEIFSTHSDTEVIMKGYEAYGISGILNRLEGMFAFAIYDLKHKIVHIARDKYGEKPLYYTKNSKGVYFASELKALSDFLDDKSIDIEALNLFLSLTYIPAPYTIFSNIRKLGPGEFLSIRQDSEISSTIYYSLREVVSRGGTFQDYHEAKSELRKLLFQSVEERMIADVPLGAFLSGGIDSSIITSIMAKLSAKPINTFSIGFKEKSYDESDRAALVAKHIGSNHTVQIVDHNDLLRATDEVLDYFDEPFADSSALPSFMVAKMARKKVTVVLTGDCADELFGGYEKYLGPYYTNKIKSLPKGVQVFARRVVSAMPHNRATNHILRKIKKVLNNTELKPFELHYNLMCLGFQDNERSGLLTKHYQREVQNIIRKRFDELEKKDPLDKGFYTDVTTVLEGDMLTKVDRMCMINSLEPRVPFLDSKIVAAAFNMPFTYKIKGRNKKRILKDAFRDLLPSKVFKFSKKGFGVPIAVWFRNELKDELQDVLNSALIKSQGIFNYQEVEKLIQQHISGKENHASKLWCLFVFQKWYNKNILSAREEISAGSDRTR